MPGTVPLALWVLNFPGMARPYPISHAVLTCDADISPTPWWSLFPLLEIQWTSEAALTNRAQHKRCCVLSDSQVMKTISLPLSPSRNAHLGPQPPCCKEAQATQGGSMEMFQALAQDPADHEYPVINT